MTEISSSIAFYIDFAKSTGREIEYKEIPYPSNFVERVVYQKRTVLIPMDLEKRDLFLSYYDPKGFSERNFYSGVFSNIDKLNQKRITIKKKYLIHRINIFQSKKGLITIGNNFDKEILIESDTSENQEINFLNDYEIQGLILDLFKIDERLRIGLNDLRNNFETSLKDTSNIGIYLIQDWLFDREKIESIYRIFLKLRALIENKK